MTAAAALPPRFTFVGGHPLAGAARGGIEHARPDLFRGRPWLLTPTGDASGEAVDKLSAFVRALGAEPRIIDVEAHDRLVAFLSHLPQLTASALMKVVSAVGRGQITRLPAAAATETPRLASSPAGIWRDIVATNADEIGPALDALIAALQELRNDLATGEELTEVFTAANRWRELLPQKPSG